MSNRRFAAIPRRCIELCVLLIVTGCTNDTVSHFDVLIVDGQIYDGSGGPPVSGNIGIVGDRIVALDAKRESSATRVISARGLTIVPGFIDPHTHALNDLRETETSNNENYLRQGVTTVVVGNDGRGLPQFADTLAQLRSQGVGTNVAFHAGHGDIREMVMGLADRRPSEDELARMVQLLDEQMQAGALGLSTGLYYTPGSYAATDEVIELAKVAARYGGIYDSHMRDESSYSIGLLGAVEEVITIAEQAGIPGHIAHLKALGRDVWGQSGDVIALIEEARERGLAITADQYPYRASGTRFSAALIPAWVRADSDEAMFGRIANPDLSARIREEMDTNLWRRGGAASLLVTASNSEWRGKTLEDIAEELGVDPIDAAVEVVRAGNPSVASFNMQPDDIHAIAIQDWVMTGSDGSAGHPRKFGSYPTAYRDMVIDARLFGVERFVRRSSGLVADTLGLCDRGYIEVGRKADVVLLDLEEYRATADFQNPTGLALGAVHVLVNGQSVIDDGEINEVLAGEVIDRQSLECSR